MSLSLIRPKTLLLAALLWGPASFAQDDAKLAEVRARIQAVQKAMESDQRAKDSTQKQVEELEQSIAAQQMALRQLKADIAKQTRRVRETEKELQVAERQLLIQKGALGRQLRAAYITGEHEQTQLLLNLDTLTRLSRMLTYYDYLNHGRVQRIGALRSLGEKLQTLIAQARSDISRLDGLKREQEKSLAALEASRSQRKQLLAQIAERLASAGSNLQSLKESESGLLKLLDRVRDSLADIPLNLGKGKKFGERKGKLPWPLRGKLLANFGAAKGVGKLTWDGIWIGAEEGTAVRAIARGRVAYTGWMRRYGLIALLEHEGGYYSLYGHTQSVSAEAGEWVEDNAVIAAAGATGGHESSGVYFELRKGSTPVNPRDWLKK
ncbi:MAG: peptidoglycan DD-metalloendopeptidase family protein [Pseudomonadota bacterium]